MSETKHTPGPWCICPETNGQEIVAYDIEPWRIRGEIFGVYKWPENWLANARLIAAAPDLLAIAEMVVAVAEMVPATFKGELYLAAQSAIAKATGQ